MAESSSIVLAANPCGLIAGAVTFAICGMVKESGVSS